MYSKQSHATAFGGTVFQGKWNYSICLDLDYHNDDEYTHEWFQYSQQHHYQTMMEKMEIPWNTIDHYLAHSVYRNYSRHAAGPSTG